MPDRPGGNRRKLSSRRTLGIGGKQHSPKRRLSSPPEVLRKPPPERRPFEFTPWMITAVCLLAVAAVEFVVIFLVDSVKQAATPTVESAVRSIRAASGETIERRDLLIDGALSVPKRLDELEQAAEEAKAPPGK